jgi:hypothetical protein
VDWRDTVANFLRGKIDNNALPALTIRVVFADFLQDPAGSRSGTTKDEGKQIVRGYMQILYPFKSLLLGGLAALYVQPAFPWPWARDDAILRMLLDPDDWWTQELAAREKRLKDFLERMPGCEAIVDARRNKKHKPEPRRSAWQTWYDVDWYDQ